MKEHFVCRAFPIALIYEFEAPDVTLNKKEFVVGVTFEDFVSLFFKIASDPQVGEGIYMS